MLEISKMPGVEIRWTAEDAAILEECGGSVVDLVSGSKQITRKSCPLNLGELCHLKAFADKSKQIGKYVCMAEGRIVPLVVHCSGGALAQATFYKELAVFQPKDTKLDAGGDG